jgi:hypothetical protein
MRSAIQKRIAKICLTTGSCAPTMGAEGVRELHKEWAPDGALRYQDFLKSPEHLQLLSLQLNYALVF